MLRGGKTEGQHFRQRVRLIGALRAAHINQEIIPAKLPHHLPAHAARRKDSGDDAVLPAYHRNGGKVPLSVVDRFKKAFRSAQIVGV